MLAMLYQHDNRTISISVMEYLSISDSMLKYMCITENEYSSIQNPFAESHLQSGGVVIIEEEDDEVDINEDVDMDLSMICLEE